MSVQKLTTSKVRRLQLAGASRSVVWDEQLTGFGVRLTRSGGKVFVVRYRIPGLGRRGNQRWITLGDATAITLEQARRLAQRTLADVAHGRDPAGDRRQRRDALTVEEFGDVYLSDVAAHRRPYTAYEYRRLFKKHVLPRMGTKRVEEVAASDVRKLHVSLRETPVVANRVRRLLRAFFTFAEREGLRPRYSNPARDVREYAEKSRERFLTSEEIARLGRALAQAEHDGLPPAPQHRKIRKSAATAHRPGNASAPKRANPDAVSALRLLLYSGCRESEILGLRWSEVDFASGFLRLDQTKTGRSVRPLNAQARAILNELPRQEGSPYVFPSPTKHGAPLKEIKRLWYAVRHAAELHGVRLHDFRHTTASLMAAGGASLLDIGAVLGHKSASTAKRYAHLAEDHIKAWSERTGNELRAGLDGVDTPVTALSLRAG